MTDVVAPKSRSTARDMVKGILEDVMEIPTMDGAARIADEYWTRGVYIRPEYLLDVWMEIWKERNHGDGEQAGGGSGTGADFHGGKESGRINDGRI